MCQECLELSSIHILDYTIDPMNLFQRLRSEEWAILAQQLAP